MKLKGITRRDVSAMADGELAKLHSQLHSADKNLERDNGQREKELWEMHNIVTAEMQMRNQKHDSPLGKESGQIPAGSDNNAEEAEAKQGIKGLDGDVSGKEPVSKPYPTEHACRIKAPGGYDKVRRKNNEFGKGIHVIYGVKDDKAEIQALRFDKDKFTAKEAKAWAKDHDYTCKPFEAAAEKQEKYECECLDCSHVLKTEEHCKDIKCPKCGGEMRRKSRPGVGKGIRITLGKTWFLFQNIGDALTEAFTEFAYAEEYDLDGPAVIACVYGRHDEGSIYYRIPFVINETGDIELDLGAKEEVERQSYYVVKAAPLTRITINKEWFLLENMRLVLDEAFGKGSAGLSEIDVDGPAAIVNVYYPDSNEMKTFRIPFSITEGGGLKLDMEAKEELELRTTYTTAKSDMETVELEARLIKTSEDDEDRFALYMVYAPNKLDSQNEWANEREIEKACWDFGAKCYKDKGGHVDVNHDERAYKYKGVSVVENTFLRKGMGKAYGVPDGTWLVGLRFDDEKLWDKVKRGELSAVSIGGRAVRRKRKISEAEDGK